MTMISTGVSPGTSSGGGTPPGAPPYASLTGAGQTSSPGELTQDGDFVVDGDFTNAGDAVFDGATFSATNFSFFSVVAPEIVFDASSMTQVQGQFEVIGPTSLDGDTVITDSVGNQIICNPTDGIFLDGGEIGLDASTLIEIGAPGVLIDYDESTITNNTVHEPSPGTFHHAFVDFTSFTVSGVSVPSLVEIGTDAAGTTFICPNYWWAGQTSVTPGTLSFFGVTGVGQQVSGGTLAGVIAGLVALGLFSS